MSRQKSEASTLLFSSPHPKVLSILSPLLSPLPPHLFSKNKNNKYIYIYNLLSPQRYSCTLIGHALPPKPQGPVAIKSSPFTLSFKNPFARPTPFTFAVDSSKFTVKPADATVGVKKTQSINKDKRGGGRKEVRKNE